MRFKNLLSILALSLIIMLTIVPASFCADLTLRWDASLDATGYKLSYSIDNGTTWGPETDVGNVTTTVLTNVPETGLVLMRVKAYNANGEALNSWQGAWYNHLWKPPAATVGLGVE